MNRAEKLDYLHEHHFSESLKERSAVGSELSDKQSMWCVCRQLATGLHESHCQRFQNKVTTETIKRLKHLLEGAK